MLHNDQGYGRTIRACFIGYISQAAVCTLAPLLYVQFQTEFALSLQQISNIITLTFGIQLLVDILCSFIVDRIGYRICAVAAHVCCALGFVMMGILPDLFRDPYTGFVVAVCFYAVGAGIIEVLISSIVQACPTERKAAMMNLLHSFFGWGQALVILLSTAFFAIFHIDHWRVLVCLWAILPAWNAYNFTKAPIPALEEEGVRRQSPRQLLRSRMFWLLLVLMISSGACELAVSQWASALVETELGVSKTVGDLAGPCMFALCMGLGRVLGTRFDDGSIEVLLTIAGILCLIGYALIALAPVFLSLFGCALCGLAVSVMWPSALSLATRSIPGAGTALFAFLALGGDIGCTLGPTWAGFCAGAFGDNLKVGILFSMLFPVLLLLVLQFIRAEQNRQSRFQ